MSPRTHPNTPTTPGIHPKVRVPAWVGVALTGATVIAHYAASLSSSSWAYTIGTGAVTVLGFVSGYLAPNPPSTAVVQDVAKAADASQVAAQLMAELKSLTVQPEAVGAGVPAPDTDAAFPDPANLPAA